MNKPDLDPVILFVDDDAPDRELLKMSLRGHFVVVEASSAAEARSVLERIEVDAVLVEERLPEESGEQFALWLHHHRPDVPVLTCAADPQSPGSLEKGRDWHMTVINAVAPAIVEKRISRIGEKLASLGGLLSIGADE